MSWESCVLVGLGATIICLLIIGLLLSRVGRDLEEAERNFHDLI